MLRIVMIRIIWSLNILLHGQVPTSLDHEHEGFCRMIWMCLLFTRGVSLVAAILFGDPVYVSYEGARGEVKEYLLTWLMEISHFRKKLPNDRDAVDRYLMSSALAFIGRGKFHERSDFPCWELSSNVLQQEIT